MRYVILGTAGHIDHGKSTLVKALTGIDPDRLKEEKERGITIDLGFADLEYPDGLKIGIIDVPGHEKLIRNMLAGAGGIDLVLLVIAADEGIMPQSREHLHICNLLKIKSGIVVITKSDTVEPDWIELVKDEAKDFVKGTFLEGAPIVHVSSKTGENLELLKQVIHDSALSVEAKALSGLFRMPIDRVFTLKGFGTVVTGTAVSGSISLDEPVEILPKGILSKVRGLQSHGKPIEKAFAGMRVAVNLQSVEKHEIERGDTLVTPERFTPTKALEAKIEILPDAPPLKNRSLVHFHTGTTEAVARVILYDREELSPGETAYCQFRLRQTIIAQAGDRFIIRRFSPLDTIGGGEVLDPSPARRKIKDGVSDLAVFEKDELDEKIGLKIKKAGINGLEEDDLEGWIKAAPDDIEASVRRLVEKAEVLEVEGILIHKSVFEFFKAGVIGSLKAFHIANPLKPGMSKEELRASLHVPMDSYDGLLVLIKEVATEKDTLRLKSFATSVSEKDKTRIMDVLAKGGFLPPLKQEIAESLKMDEKKLSDILKLLGADGSIVRINDSIYLSAQAYEKMLSTIKAHFAKKPEMSVAEFRDMLQTSRKYAVPFLENLDSKKITIRVGDTRKLLQK